MEIKSENVRKAWEAGCSDVQEVLENLFPEEFGCKAEVGDLITNSGSHKYPGGVGIFMGSGKLGKAVFKALQKVSTSKHELSDTENCILRIGQKDGKAVVRATYSSNPKNIKVVKGYVEIRDEK